MFSNPGLKFSNHGLKFKRRFKELMCTWLAIGDLGGVVLQHRTPDEEVPGSIHTGGTV